MQLGQHEMSSGAEAAYAPAIFFQAGTVLACELQLRASSPAGSGILGMVLLRSVRLSGCFLVANFEGEGEYPAAVRACGHVAVVSQSFVDLGGEGVTVTGLVQG